MGHDRNAMEITEDCLGTNAEGAEALRLLWITKKGAPFCYLPKRKTTELQCGLSMRNSYLPIITSFYITALNIR